MEDLGHGNRVGGAGVGEGGNAVRRSVMHGVGDAVEAVFWKVER